MKLTRRHFRHSHFQHQPTKPNTQRVDLWLQRASGAAQVIISIVTISTLYYTVIPLYQKAALEENVARLERETKVLEASNNEIYSRVRGLAVREFVLRAGAECSGLLIPLHLFDENPGKNTGHSNDALGIDPRSCLEKFLNNTSSLSGLKKEDIRILSEKVSSIGREFNVDRVAAIKEYEDIPQKITSEQSKKIPLVGFSEKLDKFLGEYDSYNAAHSQHTEARHRAIIQQLQLDVISGYAHKVQQGVLQLRQMDGK